MTDNEQRAADLPIDDSLLDVVAGYDPTTNTFDNPPCANCGDPGWTQPADAAKVEAMAAAQEATAARWTEAIGEADNDTDRGYATGRVHAAEQAALRIRAALAQPAAPDEAGQAAAEERRPCPHGCAGGHTEAEYYGGDCRGRDQEAFEGWGPGR
jgi:hypothetical protein